MTKPDAAAMYPQARLVLETCVSLLSHAGYRPEDLKGSLTGMYLGARRQHGSNDGLPDCDARNLITIVGQNYLAANVSRFFDLLGPGVVIDSACSSALVALHAAVRSLQAGDVAAAIG